MTSFAQVVWSLFALMGSDWDDCLDTIERFVENSKPPIVRHGRIMTEREDQLDRFWRGYYRAVGRFNEDMSKLDWITFYRNHCERKGHHFDPVIAGPRLEWLAFQKGATAGDLPSRSVPVPNPGFPTVGDQSKGDAQPIPEELRRIIDKQIALQEKASIVNYKVDPEPDDLLTRLGKLLNLTGQPPKEVEAAPAPPTKSAADLAAEKKLAKIISVDFMDVDFARAITILEYVSDAKINVDKVLANDSSEKFTLKVKDVSLKAALDKLAPEYLAVHIEDGELWIISFQKAYLFGFWRDYNAAVERFNDAICKLDWDAYYRNHGRPIEEKKQGDQVSKRDDSPLTMVEGSARKQYTPVVVVPLLPCAVHAPGKESWLEATKPASDQEKRLQRFWHDYYDNLKDYDRHLDKLDWVGYYKNHGYTINPNGPAVLQAGSYVPPKVLNPYGGVNSIGVPDYSQVPMGAPLKAAPSIQEKVLFGPEVPAITTTYPLNEGYPPLEVAPGKTPKDARQTKLTLQDIARLSQHQVSDEIIIGQINATDSTYELTVDQLIWLKEQRVNDRVVKAMQERKSVRAAESKSVDTPQSSPVKTSVIQPKFINKIGHEQDFSWVTGQLGMEYGQWVIRYFEPDTAYDQFGGKLTLVYSGDMSGVQVGDLISVSGGLIRQNGRPIDVYRVDTLSLIERR